ncbi:MAG: discoidin domain-containing protein [Eubacteriales bacterium]
MKKTLSVLLASAMILAVAPLTIFAYETDDISTIESLLKSDDNLAYGKSVIYSSALDQGEGASWHPAYLTDGSLNYHADTGDTTGYHSDTANSGKNHEEWAGVDLGEPATFDTLVVYPSLPEAKHGIDVCPAFPNAFRVDVSADGTNWSTLTITVNGDDKNAAQTVYNFDPPAAEPITITFTAVTAQYVRFVGVSLNNFDGTRNFNLKLSELAVYNKGYTPSEYTYVENVAAGKPVALAAGGAHDDFQNNWHLANINNGNRYDMCTYNGNNDYGQFCGFHSSVDRPSEIAIDITLGEGTTLNQVVIYPSSEKYSTTYENAGVFYFPANFNFQISDNGTDWETVKTVSDYSVTEYGPQVFDLGKTYTATYLRFDMTDLGGYIKLSELEVYDTAKVLTFADTGVVVNKNVNLALGASVICSSVINSGGWQLTNLNNGIIEENGGFTSGRSDSDPNPTVGIDLGAVTRVNSITLWSAKSEDERDAEWSGIPKSFEIQVSNNGFNWKTVGTYTNESVPEFGKGYTYSFDETDARYIRIATTAENVYPKGSDYDWKYIQLAEMEVTYKVSDKPVDPTDPVDPPKTGDTAAILMFVSALAVVSCAAVALKRRKEN